MRNKNNSPEQKAAWERRKHGGNFPKSLPSKSHAFPFWHFGKQGQTPAALRYSLVAEPLHRRALRALMGKYPGKHLKIPIWPNERRRILRDTTLTTA